MIERPSLRQLIWWNLSYQVAHLIWFQFLLDIIGHSAMAVLTIMTACTAMSQHDRGCTSLSFHYWLLLFVHYANCWFCKNRRFCKDSSLNRLTLQTSLFLQSTGVSTILVQGVVVFEKIDYFSIAQINNFAKIGYFAQIAYLIGYLCKITFRIIANSNPIMQWWFPSTTLATSQYSKHHDCTEIINIKSE